MTDPNQKPIAYDARPVEGFKDPDTGMDFHIDDFWTVVKKLQKHREANKLDASLPKAFSLVLCYVRKKHGLTCDGDFSEQAIKTRLCLLYTSRCV